MAKPQRSRSSQSLPAAIQKVGIADVAVDFDRYGEVLSDASDYVEKRAAKASKTHIARSLMCGRFVGAATAHTKFERIWYCKYSQLCRCCCHNVLKARGQGLMEDACRDAERAKKTKFLRFVFRLPDPGDYQESVTLANKALGAMPVIRDSISTWIRRNAKRTSNSLYDYAMGLHLVQKPGTSVLWPHIHLAIVADKNLVINGDTKSGILPYLKLAFEHAIDIERPNSVICANAGVLGMKTISEAKRIKNHRAKIASAEYVQNTFAYVMRSTEQDESTEAENLRLRLLQELGNPTTYIRSRSDAQVIDPATGLLTEKQRCQAPRLFHPVRLGKKFVYVFPLDGGKPRLISPQDYDAEYESMYAQAMVIATGILHSLNSPKLEVA